MLPSRITPHGTTSDPEDIFASALTTIFPDDTTNSHGTPGSSVTYKSPLFGDIDLQIPQHPDEEQGRKLFAHHLWNAGVVVAEAVERASSDHSGSGAEDREGEEDGMVTWDKTWWDVRGKSVLELGAGTALPSIICALVSAKSVTITDHPSSPALTTNAIKQNVKTNVEPSTDPRQSPNEDLGIREVPLIDIYGYVWGTTSFYSPTLYGKPIIPPTSFDRLIIADCLWMPSQHINLIKTILTFLPSKDGISPAHNNSDKSTDTEAFALVVAGFHTGRPTVASFFALAIETPFSNPDTEVVKRPVDPPWKAHESEPSPTEKAGTVPASASASAPAPLDEGFSQDELQHIGKLQLAEIFEIDVDLNTRPWSAVREGETKWEAKRWCVVGVLVRR